MITLTDERVQTQSKYVDEFREATSFALQIIEEEKEELSKMDWGMDRIQVRLVRDRFDEIICNENGFEIDVRTVRHAHGIGNNNEWDIVDKDLVKVGSFYCNSDMFGGVYVGVVLNGKTINSYHLR